MAVLNPSEAELLRKYFPRLRANDDLSEVEGEISFHASYDKASDLFSIINPENPAPPGVELSGTYSVLIKDVLEFEDGVRWLFPRLYIRNASFTPSMDRHFSGESACMFGPSEEGTLLKEEYSFLTYLERHVVPFLYAQTYYDQHNNEWPWAEYEHGVIGLLQSYLQSGDPSTIAYTIIYLKHRKDWPEFRKLLVSKEPPKGHTPCFCGKGDHIRRCHPELWEALKKFYADFKRTDIKLPPVNAAETQ